ncbi:hypothetical protein GYMLUDRAFT_252710 [Collybiopsis luxurians FD-317 M1]|uniref:Uncharacterized protein n=1 Tax=Collybiopsis luxurians FD-317 M1 TaxID=944289 RepID=A0A0D0BML6_9AGAR|nr:hypothetical protein GYMLUDRAFT_252710 [Collybiopsis luxurians FD-317 M1]
MEILLHKRETIKSISENLTPLLDGSTATGHASALQRAIDESSTIIDQESSCSNNPPLLSSILQSSPQSPETLSPLLELSPLTAISSIGPSAVSPSATKEDSQARRLLFALQEVSDEVEIEGLLGNLQAHLMQKFQSQIEELAQNKLMENPTLRQLKALKAGDMAC